MRKESRVWLARHKNTLHLLLTGALFLSLNGCISSDQELTIKSDGSVDMYTRGSFAFGQIGDMMVTFMEMENKKKAAEAKKKGENGEKKNPEGVEGLFSGDDKSANPASPPEDIFGGMDTKEMFKGIFGMVEGLVMMEFKNNADAIKKLKYKGLKKADSKAWSRDGVLHLETWANCRDMKACIVFTDKLVELGRKKMSFGKAKGGDPLFGSMMGSGSGGQMDFFKQIPQTEFKAGKNSLKFTIPFKKGHQLVNQMLKSQPIPPGSPFNMGELKGLISVFMSSARIQLRINTPKPIKTAAGNPLRPGKTSAIWEIPLSQMFAEKAPRDFVGEVKW